MVSQVTMPDSSAGRAVSSGGRKLFLAPGQYRTCHVLVEDMDQRLPAIAIKEAEFFTFFKVVKDREKALDILAKLFDNGDEAVITQTPKGFALWVYEETAQELQRRRG